MKYSKYTYFSFMISYKIIMPCFLHYYNIASCHGAIVVPSNSIMVRHNSTSHKTTWINCHDDFQCVYSVIFSADDINTFVSSQNTISSSASASAVKICIIVLSNLWSDVINWMVSRYVGSGPINSIPYTHPSIPTTIPLYCHPPSPKSSPTLDTRHCIIIIPIHSDRASWYDEYSMA